MSNFTSGGKAVAASPSFSCRILDLEAALADGRMDTTVAVEPGCLLSENI